MRRATLVCEWHTRPESFLSTLSLRRATSWRFPLMTLQTNFYPRSPCGERLLLCHFLRFDRHISIHALLAESDPRQYARRNAHMYFYPRSPCGERRVGPRPCGPARIISIHALLAESDGASRASSQSRRHFYPRSPCGERRQSGALPQPPPHISIHALLAESDRHWQMGHSLTRQFLSTLSLRRATSFFKTIFDVITDFYPRSPCGERLFSAQPVGRR